jgi:hypothetical protein
MPVGIIQSLPCQIIHVFICGFVSRVRGGHSMHSACLVLLSHFYVIRVGSGHLCCFPCRPPIDQPYFALCPSMPDFPLLLREDLVMCCIETYLACGRILLPFFPCYGVSNRLCSNDLEDPSVQLASYLHIKMTLSLGIEAHTKLTRANSAFCAHTLHSSRAAILQIHLAPCGGLVACYLSTALAITDDLVQINLTEVTQLKLSSRVYKDTPAFKMLKSCLTSSQYCHAIRCSSSEKPP